MVARSAARLSCTKKPYVVELGDGRSIATRAVVIASGARYRRLALPSLPRFEGAGVY